MPQSRSVRDVWATTRGFLNLFQCKFPPIFIEKQMSFYLEFENVLNTAEHQAIKGHFPHNRHNLA